VYRVLSKPLRVIALAIVLALLIPGMAFADNLYNTLDNTVDAVAEIMPLNVGGPNGTTQIAIQVTNTDGKNGCNLTAGTTLGVAFGSSNASVATVSPSSVTFTSCGDVKTLTVTPVSQGSATITASQTSNNTGATFNYAPATFTVNVSPAAPSNTAPSVSVSGVAESATYNKGSVPAATCQVTDAEDGPSSFPATLSAITGPDESDGIGSQTASCSYTDGGGLTASASKTYTIIDPSAPAISYTLNSATPDGSNGWNKSDVTLTWHVSDPQSPNSLQTTGCVDQTITADQVATTYSCSATSAGGSSGPVDVMIKRDATGPTVGCDAGPTGWQSGNVTVACTASDATSGLANAADANFQLSTNVDLGSENATAMTDSKTVTDLAGNSTTIDPLSFKVDRKDPTITFNGFTGTLGDNGWYRSTVSASWSCTDGGSGVINPSITHSLLSDGQNQSTGATCHDNAGNASATDTQNVDIDMTAPVADCPNQPSGWQNGNVTLSCTASDATSQLGVTGDATFSLQTSVASGSENNSASTGSKTVTDMAGNSSTIGPFSFMVDRKSPTVTCGSADSAWHAGNVSVNCTASDLGSGLANAGDANFTLTTNVATGTETANASTGSRTVLDLVGNSSSAGPVSGNKVDMAAPSNITFAGGPIAGTSYNFGSVPAAPTCTADDNGSGLASCVITGYSDLVGPHTLIATATDNVGNSSATTRSYTVNPWSLRGFYQPVDVNGIWNTIKGGSTVPLKFNIFSGANELTTTSAIDTFTVKGAACPGASAPTDAIELTTTGGTSLRYDTTGGQFIQNWQTPRKPGSCYVVTMTTKDGSSLSANFMLK
jgi:hypothetical protein